MTNDFLPHCDLIFCRDCLVHFSFEEIFAAIRNFYDSGAEYLLTTTFPNRLSNYDIQTGDWRPLNFQLAPFNFPAPLRVINEHCTEGNGKFADKSLGLWKISDICKVSFLNGSPHVILSIAPMLTCGLLQTGLFFNEIAFRIQNNYLA